MKTYTQNFITITLVILLSLFQVACSKDDDTDETTAERLKNMSPSRDQTNGNFMIVNETGENIYISSDPNFGSDARISAKVQNLSLNLDLKRFGGSDNTLVKLYALSESQLEDFEEGYVDPVVSKAFLAKEGGTFSPFGGNNENTYYGELRLCNETDEIIAITIGSQNNKIDGMINRGACNVPFAVAANGYTDINFLNASNLELIQTWEDVISEGSVYHITIGESSSSFTSANLYLFSKLDLNVQIIDQQTNLPLLNESCNQCPDLARNTSGKYELSANIDYYLKVTSRTGELVGEITDPLMFAAGQSRSFVLEKNNGQLELTEIYETNPETDSNSGSGSESGSSAPEESGDIYTPTPAPTPSPAPSPAPVPAPSLSFQTSCYNYGWGEVFCSMNYYGSLPMGSSITYEIYDLDGYKTIIPYAYTRQDWWFYTGYYYSGVMSFRVVLTDAWGDSSYSDWQYVSL